jgi:helicase required for RNAi-mediated heterochromatin assembly 1
MTRIGALCRVQFSTQRAERRIKWLQSRRLTPGTAIALTTPEDCFNNVCKVATVIQRPYSGGLDQDPPEIDIMWADPSQAALDPDQEFYMIESRTGFFEAARHTLVGLQLAMTERYALYVHASS